MAFTGISGLRVMKSCRRGRLSRGYLATRGSVRAGTVRERHLARMVLGGCQGDIRLERL